MRTVVLTPGQKEVRDEQCVELRVKEVSVQKLGFTGGEEITKLKERRKEGYESVNKGCDMG